jgi:hypothetical protein
MAAVFDSVSLARQAQGEVYERTASLLETALLSQMDNARVVRENDYTNLEKQSGKQMILSVFESKCQLLVPNLMFRDGWKLPKWQADILHLKEGSRLRLMEYRHPDNTVETIAKWQGGTILPEFTIILTKPKKIPTPRLDVYSAADWPKYQKKEDGTHEFDGPTPLEQIIEEPAGMVTGWRSLVTRLVQLKFTTPTEVEKVFGTVDNASWATRMGHQSHILPGI